MSQLPSIITRRTFLGRTCAGGLALGATAWSAPGAWAEELTRTPLQTAGPFYPTHLPLDTDNDLLVINDALDAAVGEVTHLSGRILDPNGNPIRNALVEIWQVDNHGAYLHEGSDNHEGRDKNFQGFGPSDSSQRLVQPWGFASDCGCKQIRDASGHE